MDAASATVAGGLRNIWTVVTPSKPAPRKVAYHPNVRCARGGGGDPVIVGPMYRVDEEQYVSEEKATDEEKAKGPVAPAKFHSAGRLCGKPVEGFDLRGWAASDIQGLPRDADGWLDLYGAILCGVNLEKAKLQGADLQEAQLQTRYSNYLSNETLTWYTVACTV